MATNLLQFHRKKWRPEFHVEGTESIVRLPGGLTRRSDLFGFADTVLVAMGGGLIFCQVTSRSNMSARLRKIQREETGTGQWAVPIRDLAREVLLAGHRILIEGWDQPGGSGTRWRDKERWVTLEDLEVSG